MGTDCAGPGWLLLQVGRVIKFNLAPMVIIINHLFYLSFLRKMAMIGIC